MRFGLLLVIASLVSGLVSGQTKVDWINQVQNKPVVDIREFDWYRTNGSGATGDLAATGAKTISLTKCPYGLAVGRWVRISGGTGTAETVALTSMSGAAGGACTLGMTIGQTHTGSWRIGSAMGGVIEANAVVCSTGGEVKMPSGTITAYARVEVCSGVTLRGENKDSTVIQIAANTFTPLASPFVHAGNPNINSAITTALYADGVVFRDFTLDGNGTNQGAGARPYSFPVNFMAGTNGVIENVRVQNFYSTGAGVGLMGPQTMNNVVRRSEVIGDINAATAECLGGFFSQAADNVFEGNFTSALCDDGFIASGYRAKRNKFIGNTAISHAGNVAFHAESSYDTEFIGNTAVGLWQGCYGATDVITEGIGNTIFSGNICKSHVIDFPNTGTPQGTPENGFVGIGSVNLASLIASPTISDSTVTVANNIIEGCTGRGISTGGLASRIIISNNQIKGCVIGLAFESNSLTLLPKAVVIRSNVIDHNVTGMLFSNATAGAKPIDYFLVDGNIVTDTFSPKTQLYGMSFTYSGGAIFDNAIITNNILSGNSTGAVSGLNLNDFRGVWSNNITSGSDAALSALLKAPGRYFQLGVPASATNPEFQFFTSGNGGTGIVDSALSASGGDAVAYNGNLEIKVQGLYMGGNGGLFYPKPYTFATLPVTAPNNSIVICTDCVAGCGAGGGSRRIAIGTGAGWTCP